MSVAHPSRNESPPPAAAGKATAPAKEPPAIIQTGLNGSPATWPRCLRAGHFAVCIEVSPPVGPNPKTLLPARSPRSKALAMSTT